MFKVLFFCSILHLIASEDVKEINGPSQLSVVWMALQNDIEFHLKDRSNISVTIKPTRTLPPQVNEPKFKFFNTTEFSDELIIPKVNSFYEFDRRVVLILEEVLETNSISMDKTLHSIVYR